MLRKARRLVIPEYIAEHVAAETGKVETAQVQLGSLHLAVVEMPAGGMASLSQQSGRIRFLHSERQRRPGSVTAEFLEFRPVSSWKPFQTAEYSREPFS